MTEIASLKLSDIYAQELVESEELYCVADSEIDPERRRRLRESAGAREVEATWIAHCIALFSDLPLSVAVAMLTDPANFQIKDRLCCGENPWLRGLEMLAALSSTSAVPHLRQSQSVGA